MRRHPAAIAATALAGATALASANAASAATDARLQGIFAMTGVVTRADGIPGERRGQHVRRSWTFKSTCASGPCAEVTLVRKRTGGTTDTLVLHRTALGSYAGTGSFPVPLRCSGRTYPHGGVASVRIALRIVKVAVVQTTPFATAISATYSNPKRVNHTPCAGALGRDSARYKGPLSSVLPGPPAAEFGASAPPGSPAVAFSDASRPGNGGAAIVSYHWDFGDPSSGAGNTSTERNPSHTYLVPGTHTVTLAITDANGLTATVSHQITVP